jgi:hypothetical protein
LKKEISIIEKVKTRITQGVLNLSLIAPESFLNFIKSIQADEGDEIPYTISKILKNNQEFLLITFKREKMEKLKENFDLPRLTFKFPRLYLKKKQYGEFLKANKKIFITLYYDDEVPRDFNLTFSLDSEEVKKFIPKKNIIIYEDVIKILHSIKIGDIEKINLLKSIHYLLRNNSIEDYDVRFSKLNDGIEITLKKKNVRFELNENRYEKFLIDSGQVKDQKTIESLKDIQYLKGISSYFSEYLKSFIEHAIQSKQRKDYYDSIKNQFKGLNLTELDFQNMEKRVNYYADVFVSFLSNNDLVLSKNELISSQLGDLKANMVEENLRELIKTSYIQFNQKNAKKLLKDQLKPLKRDDFDYLINFSINAARFGQEIIHESDFLKDYFYFSIIFKKYSGTIFSKFKLNREHFSHLPVILAYYNSLSTHFPAKVSEKGVINFLIGEISRNNLDEKSIMDILQYSRILILLYLVAQNLMQLKEKLIRHIHSEKDLNDVLFRLKNDLFIKFLPAKDADRIGKQIKKEIYDLRTLNEINYLFSFLDQKIDEVGSKTLIDEYLKIRDNLKKVLSQKIELIEKLEAARLNAGKIVKMTITKTIARPDVMAAGTFALVLIAMGLSKKIRPSHISSILSIDTTSVPRQAKKLVYIGKKSSTEFDSYEISSYGFKEKAKITVIKQLLNVFIKSAVEMVKRGENIPQKLINDLEHRLIFAFNEINLPDMLGLIREDLETFMNLLKKEHKERIQSILESKQEIEEN